MEVIEKLKNKEEEKAESEEVEEASVDEKEEKAESESEGNCEGADLEEAEQPRKRAKLDTTDTVVPATKVESDMK